MCRCLNGRNDALGGVPAAPQTVHPGRERIDDRKQIFHQITLAVFGNIDDFNALAKNRQYLSNVSVLLGEAQGDHCQM